MKFTPLSYHNRQRRRKGKSSTRNHPGDEGSVRPGAPASSTPGEAALRLRRRCARQQVGAALAHHDRRRVGAEEGDVMQTVIAPRTSVMPDNAAPDWQFSERPGHT